MMDRAGTAITLLAAGTFVGSVTYDWGFLTALGLTFEDVPTTLADHTRSALVWLPYAALGSFFVVASELFTQRMDDGKTASDLPLPKGCLETFFVNGPRWLLYISGPIWFILLGELSLAFSLGLIAGAWLVFSYWIVTHHVIGTRMSWLARRMFYYGPAVAILIFGMGWMGGVRALTASSSTAVLVGSPPQTVDVLREYETGLLYRNGDHVQFRRWESVATLNLNRARVDIWRGYRCRLIRCREPQ